MAEISYNTGENHIKSSGALERHRYHFSSRIRGADTMSYSTLPLFSLQPETKEIPLTQGQVAIVDAADYAWLSQFKWYALKVPKSKNFYACRTERVSNGKRTHIYMHRFILGVEDGREVDHKNSSGLDNRRGNLRLATSQQNKFNRAVRSNNISGYKGVTWHKARGKWRAQIGHNGNIRHLGLFATAEEAARVYDEKARELHGEYVRLNFK